MGFDESTVYVEPPKLARACVIVSRHPAAVEFIRHTLTNDPWWKQFLADYSGSVDDIPAVESADYSTVVDKIVLGNVPLQLAAECTMVVAVEFDGDPPRGQEYTLADMRAAHATLRRYSVSASDSPYGD